MKIKLKGYPLALLLSAAIFLLSVCVVYVILKVIDPYIPILQNLHHSAIFISCGFLALFFILCSICFILKYILFDK
jgi:ABC-type multidrug transport system fused ATPase/permease subunit